MTLFCSNLFISLNPNAGAVVYIPPSRSEQSFNKQSADSVIIFEVEE